MTAAPPASAARRTRRYRLNVAARVLTGVAGAYGVSALAAAALARAWPADRLQATIWATMLALLIFPAVSLWAFLARTPLRAWAGVVGVATALAAAAYALGPHP